MEKLAGLGGSREEEAGEEEEDVEEDVAGEQIGRRSPKSAP
jgi:hypothetical protein